MPFLSVREETMDFLNRLRIEGESDADLIERIVEFSQCYMITRGASERENKVRESHVKAKLDKSGQG